MTTPSERPEPRALTLLSSLLRDAVKRPPAEELERGLEAFRARVGVGKARPRAMPRLALIFATLVVCGVLAVFGVRASRERASAAVAPATLTRIEGGKLLDGGYLAESGNAGISLFFDEGSRFVLAPGARGRLRVDAGTRLALEHGAASLRITPSRDRRWSVDAGPFTVSVKGTDFTVSWDPASERFELRLRQGRVAVSGPIVGEGFALQAGQKLTVSLPKAETVITEERADGAAVTPAASAAAPSADATAPTADGVAGLATARPAPPVAAASAAGRGRGWREALGSGRWDEILADAQRDGIDSTLEKASSDDLLALADAARYRRRVDLARAALLAQRRRFPSSPRSLDATFLLGRVEELRASGKAQAIGYYDEYLSRAPAGTYAAEALGRKLILVEQTRGAASARPIAEEYLRRFPDGSYSGSARALQRVP
jgi:hypothetical protein